jgi:hypothetical protein
VGAFDEPLDRNDELPDPGDHFTVTEARAEEKGATGDAQEEVHLHVRTRNDVLSGVVACNYTRPVPRRLPQTGVGETARDLPHDSEVRVPTRPSIQVAPAPLRGPDYGLSDRAPARSIRLLSTRATRRGT